MSAFAMHAKTSAFAAGARVLSSQKKSNNNNNNNNRCERPFPVSVEIVGREICFFMGKIVTPDCASISNNHFIFGFCASLCFLPPSCDYCIAHTSHRAHEDDDANDDACVLFALHLLFAFFARACIRTRGHSARAIFEFFSSLFFLEVQNTKALTQNSLHPSSLKKLDIFGI